MLTGDNTGGGAVMLRPISLYSAGVWISAELPCVCAYSGLYVCLIPTHKIRLASDHPERIYYVCRGVSVMCERINSYILEE